LAKILSASGKQVWLGGNIGRDPFEFLDQIQAEDFVILELSSFQLQDLQQSPHVAIVLNITSDHLNHHKSRDEYVQAKSAILAFQTVSDIAILHPDLPDWFKQLGAGQKIFFDPTEASGFETKLLGRHNWENIAAATQAAKQLGIEETQIRQAVAEFEALPHRLKSLGQINGVTYVDDAFSTNIDPTIAAIEAIATPLILIVGGFDKGLDFKPLGEKIIQTPNLKGLVVIGQVTDKILSAVKGFGGKVLSGAKSMPEIIGQARSIAVPGDTILFSPGTASFDMFKNEQDRGEQFVSVVNQL
jgi:UDP-N-acetylmuramoylalanine--D-glutamate ligase